MRSLRCFYYYTTNMAANSSIIAEAMLEDKLADFWPDYPCLYDVRCPEFKNRELRDKVFQELAEKLANTSKRNIEIVLSKIKYRYFKIYICHFMFLEQVM